MSKLRPFQALRPSVKQVQKVASVPYDVVSRDEAFELAAHNPLSFLHASRPEIDLPSTTDIHADEVYAMGAANFKQLIEQCPFTQESEPALYLYRLKMGSHEQTGIVGTFSVDEYDSDQIKKHERTRRDKEDDRTRHILELKSQTGPVLLAFRDVAEVNSYLSEVKSKTQPIYQFTSQDEIEHTVWRLADSSLVGIFEKQVHELYIADGHHRAAAASRARRQLAEKNPHHKGSESYNYFLAVAFPASQLRILPYHRVVKELNGHSPAQFLEKVQAVFDVQPGDSSQPAKGEVGMYLAQKWYRLRSKRPPVANQLDVSLLQELLLEPILGIKDLRTDSRIDFVGGIRGTSELEKVVQSGRAVVAFSMHPTRLEDVMYVSDRGEIMPPKSTWFEPKLRDGIFCHLV